MIEKIAKNYSKMLFKKSVKRVKQMNELSLDSIINELDNIKEVKTEYYDISDNKETNETSNGCLEPESGDNIEDTFDVLELSKGEVIDTNIETN